jgi:transcriptional regulator with XRE-family HTH domain
MEIKKRREGMHLSQDRMLDALWDIGVSVSKNSLSSWENGKKATLSHLLALCYIFHCTLNELVILNPRVRSEEEENQLLPFLRRFAGKRQIGSAGY